MTTTKVSYLCYIKYSELLFFISTQVIVFLFEKSIPRVFIFNVIFLLQKVNCVMFAPGQQGRSRVTGLAV